MFDNNEAQTAATRSFEILFLVVIIGIFFTIVVLAVNPAEGVSGARDAQRQYDVFQISNAISKYFAEDRTLANLEADLGTIQVCEFGNSFIGTGVGGVDLAKVLVDDYLFNMPVDPKDGCNMDNTCYNICKSQHNNRLTISAPNGETYKIEASR